MTSLELPLFSTATHLTYADNVLGTPSIDKMIRAATHTMVSDYAVVSTFRMTLVNPVAIHAGH